VRDLRRRRNLKMGSCARFGDGGAVPGQSGLVQVSNPLVDRLTPRLAAGVPGSEY